MLKSSQLKVDLRVRGSTHVQRLSQIGGVALPFTPIPQLALKAPAAASTLISTNDDSIRACDREWKVIVAGEYKDQRAIAAATSLNERYVSRIIRSAFLAPEIVEAIVKGRQEAEMTLAALIDDVPLRWAEQNARIAALCER